MRAGWLMLWCGAAVQAAPVAETSYALADGSRVLRHEVVVAAPVAEAWRALTTAEGWRSWAVPFAHGEFALGAEFETSYDAEARPGDPANIRTRVLAYLPERMFAFQAVHAPPGFKHAELLPGMFSVAEFEALDARRTRVSLSGVGYLDTPAHRELFEFFKRGNAWTLERLAARLESGPVDWRRHKAPGAETKKN